MKGKTSCKYYQVCGSGINCYRCSGYEPEDHTCKDCIDNSIKNCLKCSRITEDREAYILSLIAKGDD